MNFNNLLNKFRCKKTDEYTHLSMYPYGGVYKIPDGELKEFYERYQGSLDEGYEFGVLERPLDDGPILVDVDIKIPIEQHDVIKLLYSYDQIKRIISVYQKTMMETIQDLDLEDLLCIVLEKSGYKKGGHYKNGFHLHFPKIWLPLRHRKIILKETKKELTPEDEKLIDPCSVKSNWFLYGSMKNPNAGAYKVSYGVNIKGESSTLLFGLGFTELLSIRNSPLRKNYKLKENILSRHELTPKTKLNLDPKEHDDLIEKCLESISDDRADECPEWIKIGCILKTLDPENGLERWRSFSQRSYKYDENHLGYTWERFGTYNYSIGSLIYMARQDNPKFSVVQKTDQRSAQRLLSRAFAKPMVKAYNKKELQALCKERNITGCSTKTKKELSKLLEIPLTENIKYEKHCREQSKIRRKILLTDIILNTTTEFKSIYSTAKHMNRNTGSIHSHLNSGKLLVSRVNGRSYKVNSC